MKVEELKDQMIRAAGYSEGFKAGYAACLDWFVVRTKEEHEAAVKSKKEAEK